MFEWAVIGAGPAGIAAVGKLLDLNIPGEKILWIDPHFTVGDFGKHWSNVPSNTKVKLFLKFLTTINAFNYTACPTQFALHAEDPESTCYLQLMVEPLQWVSDNLRSKVETLAGWVDLLKPKDNHWLIHTKDNVLTAKNVILAVGAEPKTLTHKGLDVIPLQVAMDKNKLNHAVHENDTVAVFGSSHSAILALRNLIEIGAKRVINFYRSPLLYAIYYEDWILWDDTGLKGTTADWAKENLEGKLPANLERVFSDENNLMQFLPQCNKVIYAVGFETRSVTVDSSLLDYTQSDGQLASGLYGLGIAYPEAKHNRLGILEYRVGLWKFMDYINRVMPVWVNA